LQINIFLYKLLTVDEKRVNKMSYQKTVRRLTIPMETTDQLKTAATLLLQMSLELSKIDRSPNSVINKLCLAQSVLQVGNWDFKAEAGDGINSQSYYKKST
jgi:hypothetical protein|tara:strand:- start:901 stop:1203 length:303 start_codon:yes stop_codon:yes gene_type:complete